MPSDVDNLCAWFSTESVAERADGELCTMALYRPEVYLDDAGERYQVVVRLQGFVEDASLAPLGNWNGKETDAAKAVQFLTLGHGGFPLAFEAQNDALNAWRKLIMLSLSQRAPDTSLSHATIWLKRRVFTRVRPTYPTAAASVLTKADDPLGKAAKIATCWVVLHKVMIGSQRSDGRMLPCDAGHLLIRRGDFVDVAVFAEIFKVHTRQGVKIHMSLAMQNVVRLYSARELKDVVFGGVLHAMPAQEIRRPVRLATGIHFDEAKPSIEQPAAPVDEHMADVGGRPLITPDLGRWSDVQQSLPDIE
ncbi:hypothetical protein A0H81_05471 [Grifola frondosa]|uniref:Uncharacterized protein n=1 Tax=Grifola frondosa TaxID=5627 RepID=A0A1C7MDK9_GRIFR|nr:hypothetical protein A0H81_05471 [Grifola frondosa]